MTLLVTLCLLIICSFAVPITLGYRSTDSLHRQTALRLSLIALAVALLYLLAVYELATLLNLFKLGNLNWLGKFAAIALMAGIYIALPKHIRAETGILRLPRPAEWHSSLFISGIAVMFFVFCNSMLSLLYAHICRHPSVEAVWFAATLPGLDEEMAFRGILLAILVGAFDKPWRVLGIRVGWGAVAVICFFGAAHGFETAAQGAPWLFSAIVALISGLMGALLLWLKERTGSIWLGVLVHNLANVSAALICS